MVTDHNPWNNRLPGMEYGNNILGAWGGGMAQVHIIPILTLLISSDQ